MKQILTFFFATLVITLFAQVNVTFRVDMTGQTVSSDGVHIAGSLNNWTPDANRLTDQGNNIYAITLSLQPGADYEYKFLNGNAWGTDEAAPNTCTVGGSNRIFTAPTEDMMLTVTPFNGCPSSVSTQMVKFSVDMTGQTVSGNGVHVAGNFNGWSPSVTALSSVGNNIYEVTVPVLSSINILQYKFLNGNDWGFDETPGAGCGNGSNNRAFILKDAGSSVELPLTTFGGCSNPIPTKTVVFRTNLGGATPSPDGVHVAGSFQGWDPSVTQMNNVGGGNYELAVDMLTTTAYFEYKYINGNAWGLDESVPQACSFNNNRFKIMNLLNVDTTFLGIFEFGTCENLSVSTSSVNQPALFQISPTITNESILVTWQTSIKERAVLTVFSIDGSVAFQESLQNIEVNNSKLIEVQNWSSGLYIVQLRTAKGQFSQKVVVQ